jgi:SAM-dependent methyltransferase
MGYNWIDPKEFSINCILLMDRWLIRYICKRDNENFRKNFGIALAANPVVAWYCREKAPEISNAVDALIVSAPKVNNAYEVRAAECFVLADIDWAVVYLYPETMNKNCEYIYDWDKERLYELADFGGKVVLDVGAGTGRLTFAAAPKAKHIYASEPVDRLREFMRDEIKRQGIKNITVLDGICEWLPYEDNTFDIVMSGHVLADDWEKEIAEQVRVCKSGGWLLDCSGDNDEPKSELVKRGWEEIRYTDSSGTPMFNYRKQVVK